MRGTHCQGCGTALTPRKPNDNRRKWCSERCRKDTLYAGECVDCGARTSPCNGRGPNAPARCQRCSHAHRRTLDGAARHGGNNRRWSNDDIAAAIRKVAVANGGAPTITGYLEAYRPGGMPSLPTVITRFGSWAQAAEHAGYDRPALAPYANRVGAARCVAAVVEAAAVEASGARSPTANEYGEWSRGRGDAPSVTTIRRRVGSWLEARRRAEALL